MLTNSAMKIKTILRIFSSIYISIFFVNCSKNYYNKIDAGYFKTDENTYKFKDFVYQGTLSADGVPVGKGKITYNNGIVASGYFKNSNLEDDNASLYIPGTGTITGKCINGTFIYGTIRYYFGNLYTGEISNYEPNGQGEYRKNNLILVGTFKKGVLNGPGAIIDTVSKTKTYSEFRNGLPNGITGIEEKDKKIRFADFENGIDASAVKKDAYINNYVKSIEFKELKPKQDSIENIKAKIENLNTKLQGYKFNYKSPESACLRNGMYLTVATRPKSGETEYSWISGFGITHNNITTEQMQNEHWKETVYYGYSENYYERTIEREIKVIGPIGLSRSEIQKLLLAKKSIIKEKKQKEATLSELCNKWRMNPQEYQQEIERYLNNEYYEISELLTQYNDLLKSQEKSVENRLLEQKRLESVRRNQATVSYNKLAEDRTAEIKNKMCLFRPCLFCPPKNAKVTCQ